jgi:hypothetical protein
MPNEKRENQSSSIYCYTWNGGDYWELFVPRHEPAAVRGKTELEMQLIRIRFLKKGTAKVLCLTFKGKAPEKIINHGAEPKTDHLKELGARVHKVIEL